MVVDDEAIFCVIPIAKGRRTDPTVATYSLLVYDTKLVLYF